MHSIGNKELVNMDIVTPNNNFGSCLFSQAELTINNVLITNSTKLYPYKCYFENLLNFNDELVHTKGALQGFEGYSFDTEDGVNDIYDPKYSPTVTTSPLEHLLSDTESQISRLLAQEKPMSSDNHIHLYNELGQKFNKLLEQLQNSSIKTPMSIPRLTSQSPPPPSETTQQQSTSFEPQTFKVIKERKQLLPVHRPLKQPKHEEDFISPPVSQLPPLLSLTKLKKCSQSRKQSGKGHQMKKKWLLY
ncbi:hypothetical protein CHUAL_009668 [Chamberlinius hualienensis]